MSITTLNTKFQLRRDSYSNWHTANPKLDDGEPILVEVNGVYKLKIGDGNTYFDNLPYYGDNNIPSYSSSDYGKVLSPSSNGLVWIDKLTDQDKSDIAAIVLGLLSSAEGVSY